MSRRFSIWLALSFLSCSISAAQDEPCEWTSDTGTTLKASLVASETIYVLRKEDGTEIRVPANRLSPESRTLAEKLLTTQRRKVASKQDIPAIGEAGKGHESRPDAEGFVPNKPVEVAEIRLPASNPFLSLSEQITSVIFSPPGRHLFLFSSLQSYPDGGGKGSLWDTTTWRRLYPTSPDCDYFGGPAAFSPDGVFLACQDGELVRIWQINADTVSLVNTVGAINYNDVLVWADDGTLVTRDPERNIQFLKYDKVKGAVRATALGNVRDSRGRAQKLSGCRILVSPKGDYFGEHSSHEGISLWKIPSGEFLTQLEPSVKQTHSHVVIAPDGKWIGASRAENPPWGALWQGSSPRKTIDLKVTDTNPEEIGAIKNFRLRCFSPDAKKVATSEEILVQTATGPNIRSLVAVWDTATGKHLFQFDVSMTGNVLFSPRGNTLVVGGAGGEETKINFFAWQGQNHRTAPQAIEFRDAETGERRFHITDVGISTLALAPDGKTLLTCYHKDVTGFMGAHSTPIRVWEVK